MPLTGVTGSCHIFCKESVDQCAEETARLRETIDSLKVSKENSVDVLMKHVLREFLTKMNIDLTKGDEDIYKMAHVTLSTENLRLIKKYLASTKISDEFSLREDIRFALENFIVEADHRSESSLFSMLHSILPYVTMLNILILPVALMVVVRSIFSVRQLLLVVLVGSFFVSCYFTYARKYQEILAQRFERVERKLQDHCTPGTSK
uniref:Chloride channel CLIC-like protein 1 n=1 Tax=Ditylenchus dipsaci TaxID=166011 RepID=A0A915ER74_9BILA